MKNLKQTKQFLFRVFLAGLFLFLYTSAASANPLSAQDGISDGREKASATLIKWTAYQGLDEGELSSGIWQFCGRAELGALPGETYYDGFYMSRHSATGAAVSSSRAPAQRV